MCEFSRKVILITGASSGIGAAIAKAFAKRGASLSLTGRNEERLNQVVQECKDIGAKEVLPIIAELENNDDIERIINETIEEFGQLDVLVNNAGIVFIGQAETVKMDDFDKTFNVNVKAPLFLTQKALPHLEKTKGNVVNISSIASQSHLLDFLAYCMSKAALDQFTKTAALDVSRKGIRVNSVNPGHVVTEITKRLAKEVKGFSENQAVLHPLGKKNLEVEEVTDAILFLASDSARAITGTCLMVDRGRALTGQ